MSDTVDSIRLAALEIGKAGTFPTQLHIGYARYNRLMDEIRMHTNHSFIGHDARPSYNQMLGLIIHIDYARLEHLELK